MLRTLLAICLLSATAQSQTITGLLTGSLRDSSGQAVADAEVILTNQANGARVQTATDSVGNFTITGLQPATYAIAVGKSGFKRLERGNIVVTAGERRTVGELTLELGAVTETVNVTSQAANIQTVSAERSGQITGRQATDLMLIGRDYLDLLRTLPGVADFGNHEAPGNFGFNVSFQGNRTGANNITLDGASNLNTGGQTGTWLSPSVDAIGEVKVLLNNYQAEYGSKSGASVSVITKSGGQKFHGGGYYFKRNEWLNANDYFFNQRGQLRPRYRYDFGGYNIGGPVSIPGRFNSGRDKLFFFFSQEFLPQSFPNALNLLTVPTAAERQGDFSNSLDQNRRLIPIRDPDSTLPFAGNRIPANRIDSNMQKLLGVLPASNAFDPNGSYNYVTGDTYRQPRNDIVFRVDYRLNEHHSLYFRGVRDRQTQSAGFGVPAQGGNWPLIPSAYDVPSKGGIVALENTLSPTLIHQFSFGVTQGKEQLSPLEGAAEKVSKSKIGMTLGQFNPEINTLGLVPNATFGGVPNPANIAFESRYPFAGVNNLWTLTDDVTKVHRAHTFKAGVFYGRIQRASRRGSVFSGAFDFSRDVNNPLDTGYAYSNAVLGVFRSYSESNNRLWTNARASNIEWYAQDTWKITRRFTLDYGLRFAIIQPQYERDGFSAGFDPARYDPANAAILVRGALDSAGRRVGLNPVTDQFTPALLIGSIAKGDPANGMVVAARNKDYPRALQRDRGLHYGPRIGFAYDATGDGKTAVRGGFGLTYDRINGAIVGFAEQPPLQFTPTSFFGRTADFLQSGRVVFPSSSRGVSIFGQVPATMSFSLGVQRDIGHSAVLDVAYVGTLSRHQQQSININGVRPGATFLAANQDPTLAGRPLPPDFLRPYAGLGDLDFITYDASSNYHSMQVQVNRRFAKGLQLGSAWTWSKTMDTSDGGQVSAYLNQKARYYGRAGFDRTHIVNINWIYDLPKASRYWKNLVMQRMFDDWQFTGIAGFISGAPTGIGLTTTDGADITGSTNEAARVDVIARPEFDKGQRSVLQYFNTSAFARPARGTLGSAAKDVFRGPGVNNWDMALYKNIYVRESARLQFRWETYNTFNHTQFAGIDTTARFDPAGKQVNGRFGQIISSRSPRRMQLALKFIF